MVLVRNKFISFLANANIILSFAGYQFITSLFSDSMTISSQIVTIPFRALCLAITILLIFIPYKSDWHTTKAIRWFFVYWLFLIIRFVSDIQDLPNYVEQSRINQYWLYMICMTLLPMVSTIKSVKYINADVCLKWIYILSCLAGVITFFYNTSLQTATNVRLEGNVAMGSISLGHLGLTIIILGLYYLLYKKPKITYRLVIILFIVLGFVLLLRAGSRGPILALAIVCGGWLLLRSKNILKNLLPCIVIAGGVFICADSIEEVVGEISPVLKTRFFERKNQLDDREPLYDQAIESFGNSPVIGGQFAIYRNFTMTYPHNLFLESLMQTGILGFSIFMGILLVVLQRIRLLLSRDNQGWIAILWLQQFSFLLVSGSVTLQPPFSILTILVLLISSYNRRNVHS